MDLPWPKREESRVKPEYLEKTPDNQSENQYHIICENSPTQQGVDPSPSNIGDKFAWSKCDDSNQLSCR